MLSVLQTAAKTAQRTLASMAGAATPTTANFTLAGTSYQGVLQERSTATPALAPGIEVIRELHIVAERTQFSAKPSAATRPAVTALGANWLLTDVAESPLHYFLTCRPAD